LLPADEPIEIQTAPPPLALMLEDIGPVPRKVQPLLSRNRYVLSRKAPEIRT
jgi:hypothetical protein